MYLIVHDPTSLLALIFLSRINKGYMYVCMYVWLYVLVIYGFIKRYWKNKHTRLYNSEFKNRYYFVII